MADSMQIPNIALGTFKETSEKLISAVLYALSIGYRHLDLAFVYDNEELIGRALRQTDVPRSEIFITNKLACCHQHKVKESLDGQLERCGLSYFDLYLIHWPMAFDPGSSTDSIPLGKDGLVVPMKVDYVDVWKEMSECKASGKVKQIGVSNFNIAQLQRLHDNSGEWPAVNQIEVNPYCPEWDLVQFCQNKGIVVEAYAPFGAADRAWKKPSDPVLLNDSDLSSICKRLNNGSASDWTVAKLIIKWLMQRNIVVVVKSVSPKRIEDNLMASKRPDLPDWAMDDIRAIKRRFRYYQIPCFLKHPNYPYEIWDQ